MSGVSTAFGKAAAENRAALVGYLPAGFPDKQTAIKAAVAMVEAGGDGDGRPERSAATLTLGTPGVLHGMRTYVLQDAEGQTLDTHSISAGLDYPGVGPEHSWLKDTGRAEYRSVSDAEAMEGFAALCKTEGIIPALESSHAVAGAMRLGPELGPDSLILFNLSGRGDKDVATASAYFGV